MQRIKDLSPKSKMRSARAHQKQVLAVVMKFRLIVNSTKRHFKWVETQCGINGAQLWVLWELGQEPGLSVTELAAAMAIHQSTASNLIDRLVRQKLIARKRVSDDQRVVTISLTNAGKRLLGRAPKPARGMLPEALHQLREAELTSLDKLFERVLDQMHATDKRSMKQPLADLLTHK